VPDFRLTRIETWRSSESLTGQWLFVLSGTVETGNDTLKPGDSFGVEDTSITVKNLGDIEAQILLFSVPLR